MNENVVLKNCWTNCPVGSGNDQILQARLLCLKMVVLSFSFHKIIANVLQGTT